MKELTVFEKFDMLPRRLDVIGNGNRNGRYRIIIIDNETSGSANCCIIRYAKEWKDGFSNDNLFEVQGKSLEEAIFNMYEKYLVLKFLRTLDNHSLPRIYQSFGQDGISHLGHGLKIIFSIQYPYQNQ